jgi:small-conductance mechanosensitive channel
MKFTLLFLLLLCLLPQARAARDDERIASVETQIQTLDTIVQGSKSASEKARLEVKLQRLRDELAILRQRRDIESRVRALSEDRAAHPLDALREKLRLVDASEEDAKKRIQDLMTKRRQAATERDALVAQLDKLRKTDTPPAAPTAASAAAASPSAELEERVFTRNEELRSLSMQRECAELEVELAHEAERLREELKNFEHSPRTNLRAILEANDQLEATSKLEERLGVRSTELAQNLQVSQGSLTLAQQKLAKFDEELALLEKQTGFFSSDARIERLLVVQRGQKKALQESIPHLDTQITALRKSTQMLGLELDLIRAERGLRELRFTELKDSYVNRLRWPIAGLAGVVALYFFHNYILVSIACRREKRPIARRLGRYGAVLLATAVVGGFLFDDLSMFAATLGIVSAALVISLQDVCTSVFGWFVIMLASKFRIGDRLEIDSMRGDVIDVDLLSTTLIEVNGWLDSEQPTGRVVVVPNNFIFKSKVLNYNHEHPFIWNRLNVTVTFESPLALTLDLFGRELTEITRAEFDAARKAAAGFANRYGIEDADYIPRIQTQIVDTGVLLSLYYVAHYKECVSARTRINEGLLRVVGEHPEIQFSNPTINLIHTNTPPPPAARSLASAIASRPPGSRLDPIVIAGG